MKAQEYTINNNMLYQDRKSTILVAKDGHISAGDMSRHIYSRVFSTGILLPAHIYGPNRPIDFAIGIAYWGYSN